ncbi:MAG: CPBP family intramembrane metalloprotease [Actinomycetota bacterium]|nr:CPBP family intramembrane metalloprotease [Actinomycetota bacterium]
MSIEQATALDVPGASRGGLVGAIGEIVRLRPLVWFFLLAFALSWSPSVVLLVTGSGPPILGFGPFLAAVAVLALTVGKPGVKALFRSMVKWRVGLRWWAAAILVPILLTTVATVLNVAIGAPAPSSEELSRWPDALLTALLILCVPFIGGAWEEPGWRGYALPRLLASLSPMVGSLVLGVVWAAWHTPLFLTGDQHWSDLVLVVFAAVVFTWLFQNALGSVLIAMVLHATNNAVSGEYFSQMFSGADSVRQSWLLVLVWGIAAALVASFARGFGHTPDPGREPRKAATKGHA